MSESQGAWSYVPIDPCQPVISGLRIAVEERMAIQFIDLETNAFQPQSSVLPDPYALRTVRWRSLRQRFCKYDAALQRST